MSPPGYNNEERGGDEFLVVAPNTESKCASNLAERLREDILETDFGSVKNITISLGVAEIKPGETKEQLLKRADKAMYEAKSCGRNHVMVSQC